MSQRSWIMDQGSRIKDQGPRIKVQGPRIKVQGPRIKDHGPCFGTNEHPRRDTDVISRLSKSTIKGLSKYPSWVAKNPLPSSPGFFDHDCLFFGSTGSGILGSGVQGSGASFWAVSVQKANPKSAPAPPLLDQSRVLRFQYKCLGKMQFYPFLTPMGLGPISAPHVRPRFFFGFYFFLSFGSGFFCQIGSRKSGPKDSRKCSPKWTPKFQNIHPVLGASWGALGRPGGPLEASWGRLGAFWWLLGASPKR